MVFSREQSRIIAEDLNAAVQSVLAKHGLRAIGTRSTYGQKLQWSVEMLPTAEKMATVKKKVQLTQQQVEWGMAEVGDVLFVFDREANDWMPARIIKVQRLKYVFEFVDYESDGQFQNAFKNFRVVDPNPKKKTTKKSA